MTQQNSIKAEGKQTAAKKWHEKNEESVKCTDNTPLKKDRKHYE